MTEYSILNRPNAPSLAYVALAGKGPTLVFIHGFMSDMEGAKALALEAHCHKRGHAFIRFDCSGHGKSDGAFRDCTIGSWLDDVLAILDQIAIGPAILVGSSMGGWLALLAATLRPKRIKGLILLAAAPDFTEWGLWDGFTIEEQAHLKRKGFIEQPSLYSPTPYIISYTLIEEAKDHLLLAQPITYYGPVRLIHGQLDPDVPWLTALNIADKLTSSDVRTLLIKDGDHRLSRPQDLHVLCETATELMEKQQ